MSQEYRQLWRFYVERSGASVHTGKRIFLSEEESRLAAQVLRLREGEEIELADGLGWTARAVIAALQKRAVEVEVRQEGNTPRAGLLRVAVVGLPKPGALDEVVQAAVDAGLEHLIFFRGERSTSKQEFKIDKINRQVFELSRITKSPWNLVVHHCESLIAALEITRGLLEGADARFFVCDERPVYSGALGPTFHLLELLLRSANCHWACVVGPEASFSTREYEILLQFKEQSDLEFVALGQRILRTPAAVAAAAWMMAGCREGHLQTVASPNSAQTPK